MTRSLPLLFALAALPVAQAQMTGPAVTAGAQSAPIVRGYSSAPDRPQNTSQPIAGVWLRTDPAASVKVVSATGNATEIRVEHGRANLQVYHPAEGAQITVDLPGGQTALLKDGFYTFNADTDTVRTLRGEAESYPGGIASNSKAVKVKEDRQYAFSGKPTDVDPRQLMSDVVPGGAPGARGEGYAQTYGPGYGAGYGPYGDGYYDYPPYPYPYAYGFGYPYAYPFGFGLGFGYYGGYYGGFRGGYYGGRFGRR